MNRPTSKCKLLDQLMRNTEIDSQIEKEERLKRWGISEERDRQDIECFKQAMKDREETLPLGELLTREQALPLWEMRKWDAETVHTGAPKERKRRKRKK